MSVCPTCNKSNCGNWAACARRAGAARSKYERDYSATIIWYAIGVAEALFQAMTRSMDTKFLLALSLNGAEAVRRELFIEAVEELDHMILRKGRKA